MSKIIAHAWLTGVTCVGVIITHDADNIEEPYKARIGAVGGADEKQDLRILQACGTRLMLPVATPFIEAYGRWINEKQHQAYLEWWHTHFNKGGKS
jgi:hypothetical protein